MKKRFFTVFILACSLVSLAQESTFQLSEDESKEITESASFKNLLNYHSKFLEIISGALGQGIPLSSMRSAARDAVESGNSDDFYDLVFRNAEYGKQFIENFAEAKRRFVEENKFIGEHPEIFTCSTCKKTPAEEVEQFFDLFEFYQTSKPLLTNNEDYSQPERKGPTCGSYWNQLKLGICSTGCVVVSGGLGLALCGWGCWCNFCTTNSELAYLLCQH